MNGATPATIQRLLASEFERRGWEYDLEVGRIIVDAIGRGTSSPSELARLVPGSFRGRSRASREDLVDAITAAFAGTRLPTAAQVVGDLTPMRVLFVAAGPSDEKTLRLMAEHRDVAHRIRSSTGRSQVALEPVLAARPTDLIDALNRSKPTILHLAGHGGPTGIALEDDAGFAADVSTDQLTGLVAVADASLRLVVMNTCESAHQAEPMTAHVDAAIGMTRKIGDDAARIFAAQLYASLAEGVPLGRGFDQARLQISLAGSDEDQTPMLFVRPGVDPAAVVFTI